MMVDLEHLFRHALPVYMEKHFNLQVSVSSMSLQSTNISYQVDAILGVSDLPLQIPSAAPYGV
jgi:hypothetical protein